MSKYTDYIETGAKKFVELEDTPDAYDPGKYVKVETDGLNYADVETSSSGVSGGGLNYNYYFDTSTSGTLASGTIRLDSDNYPAVSSVDISYHDKDNNDLSDWINSWDDSDKSIKGTLTLQSASKANKYAMFKLTETLDTTFGSGKDGDVTISGTVNLNTTAVASGRTYADMVAYSVSTVGANSCQTTETPNGIEAGDAVLLINLQGANSSNIDNSGNYEVFIVDSIVSTTVSFKSRKTKFYGNNGGDSNIGTGATNNKVMLMRIPQYDNLTINSGATLTASDWNSQRYGTICIMCKTKATIIGSILASKGYSGRDGDGESYGGAANNNLGGGHAIKTMEYGGGGAYANNGTKYGPGGAGGTAYGTADLSKLYFGSAGGAGHNTYDGGKGGGIVAVFAKEFDLYGSIRSNGWTGQTLGGDGAGGSVLIKSNKITMHSGQITAPAATGGTPADGSVGRIAIYYNALMDSLSNVNPTPYTDSLTSGADKIDYNTSWLNNSGKFDNNEEVIVSYAYNY